MTRRPVITTLLWAGFASLAGLAHSAGTEAVMVEIVDGDTSFLVDEKANKAWWVVGECRKPIPMTSTPVSVDVYNSVRGGWSQIEVKVNETCAIDSACRRLAELPEC